MNTLMSSYLGMGIIALILILIIVSIIKKAIKLFIFVMILFFSFSAYNIFAKNVYPLDLFNTYKTNIIYSKDVADYSFKVNNSISKIKTVILNKNLNNESINVLKDENSNLKKYLLEFGVLKHSESLNNFHNNYCDSLKNIVNTSNSTIELANNKNINSMLKLLDEFNSKVDQLTKLSGNI